MNRAALFPHALPSTRTAISCAVRVVVAVCFVIRMAFGTMRNQLGSRSMDLRNYTTVDVYRASYRLQMIRIDAAAHATQMI
jgi:hypothetical protein